MMKNESFIKHPTLALLMEPTILKILKSSLERLKTLGSIYFLLPGPKMIWQFGELGYDISINQNGRLGQNQYYGIITMSNKEEMSMTLGHIL